MHTRSLIMALYNPTLVALGGMIDKQNTVFYWSECPVHLAILTKLLSIFKSCFMLAIMCVYGAKAKSIFSPYGSVMACTYYGIRGAETGLQLYACQAH